MQLKNNVLYKVGTYLSLSTQKIFLGIFCSQIMTLDLS